MTIRVPLIEQRDASYDILIEAGLVRQLDAILKKYCPAAGYAVISDSHVGKLYGEEIVKQLSGTGCRAELLTFPAGESSKTRETWASLSDQMLAAQLGRDSAVIALGGGVVNDVAGFVAATYLRGVPLVQVPTSLLAMIDSSIGGKTGVDVPAGKNLLGAFHQPRVVIADPDLLGSLASVQLAAGLAEAVKHGVIADGDYFAFLEAEYAALFAKHAPALERLVRRSVEIKAAVVAQDERERGRRAILNFGHTVGHAIEAATGMLHGEAVGLGLVAACRVSSAIAGTRRDLEHEVVAALRASGLPGELDPYLTDEILARVQVDKKRIGANLKFIVIREVGVCEPIEIAVSELRTILRPATA